MTHRATRIAKAPTTRLNQRKLPRFGAPAGCFSTGPQEGSAIDVLDGLLASRRLALHPVAQEVGDDHVIPAAAQAHLDDDDLELAVLVGHLLELRRPLDPAGELTELVAEGVAEVVH